MTTAVKNQWDSQEFTSINPKEKSGSNSSVIGKDFLELYNSMNVPRKPLSQLKDTSDDMSKAIKGIDEAMNLATKLMIISTKHMGIPNEDGNDSKAQETAQTAQSIASMMATKAGVQAQIESIEQQKKPAIDLLSLKDKQVEYNDSKREFVGKPVTYNYRIAHNESDPTASVNLTMALRNEQGIAVRTIRQTTETGEFSYEWDGKNDRGDLLPPGTYTLDVNADGRKIIGGKLSPFAVTASTTLVGKVEGIKIENGTAIGVVINGKIIARNNITDVRDMPTPELEVSLTPDLIGKKVELDFSRAKVKADGSMEVYFNNHIENPGDVTVRVYDKSGKFLTTLTNKNKIDVGIGKISFSNTNLDAGVYDIKVFVQDKENSANIKDVELSYNESIIVAGVSKRYETLISIDEKTYDPIHITSVLGNYSTPIEQRRAELIGSEVMYRDDLFKYDAVENPISFTFKLPEEDAVIATGRMNIYDKNTEELIAIVNAEYDLNSLLNDQSQQSVNDYVTLNYQPVKNYAELSKEKRIEVNRHIKNEITAGKLIIDDAYLDLYNNGRVTLTFPVWNGQDMEGNVVSSNRQLRRDFTPIYSLDNDGKLTTGDTDIQKAAGRVEAVDEIEGELKLHIKGGGIISEDLVLAARK